MNMFAYSYYCNDKCSFKSICYSLIFFFFFFNDTATTEIYTLSLHDALPIFRSIFANDFERDDAAQALIFGLVDEDRKSTRLNSSHSQISYAVFCLKKKKEKRLLNVMESSATITP